MSVASFLRLRGFLKDGDCLFGIVHHLDYRSQGLVVQTLYATKDQKIEDFSEDIASVCGFALRHKGILVPSSSDPLGDVLKALQPIIHRELKYEYITEEAPRFNVHVSDEDISIADYGEKVLSWHIEEWKRNPSFVRYIVQGVIMAYLDPDDFCEDFAIDERQPLSGRPTLQVGFINEEDEEDLEDLEEGEYPRGNRREVHKCL